jgi:hypothetical protein
MRFFDMLNTPKAVAVALVVALVANAVLYFGVYSPRLAPSAQLGSATPVERVGAVAVPGAPGAPQEGARLRPAGEAQYR